MIDNITVAEIKEFYPVTDSLTQNKINELMNFVKMNTFLSMFGLEISTKISSGTIPNSDSVSFVGFRKFVSLCIVGQLIEDTFLHTNAGLKVINQPNWTSPRVAEKNNTLMRINATIDNQFIEAKTILTALGFISENKFVPYSSFNISKI